MNLVSLSTYEPCLPVTPFLLRRLGAVAFVSFN